MTTCSVIIPVYNSESTLPELVRRLSDVLPQAFTAFEVILVNDGSKDGSWRAICELASDHIWLKGINLMRNYGQHNAILCGVREAKFAITITMDDDLQHPPEEIPKLINKLHEGYDVVYGSPRKLPHIFWRNLFSRLTKRVLALVMGIPGIRDIGAFRAFRTDLRKAFNSFRSPHVILDVLLSWGTSRFGTTVVEEAPRTTGKSNYTISKLVSQTAFILTGFSTIPLRLASLLGFFMVVFGIIILAYVLIAYFTAGSIPGFPFTASIVSLFSGAQLFSLGIFGEYLAHVFNRSMDRPTYVVGEMIDNNQSHQS